MNLSDEQYELFWQKLSLLMLGDFKAGLPSAEDLDAVAEEHKITEATDDKRI